MTALPPRIWLSTPHMGGGEMAYVRSAFDTNWIAPLGPNVDAFEEAFSARTGSKHAVAMVSGTAALHVALRLLEVGPGDTVLVSDFTFVASVTPIIELGATPVFVDADRATWNVDPGLLAEVLAERAEAGRLPRAIVVVHLFGQCADMDPILDLARRYDVPVVEDAAEALGATYGERSAGSMGRIGIFSFNGNKIITTSGGGMLTTDEEALAQHAHKLITQAREQVPYYEHVELGYNYRMSNVLAGIGRGQLEVLDDRIAARRSVFETYRARLGDLPGVAFMPQAPYGLPTHWLSCLTIDPQEAGVDREAVRLELERRNIDARPVWKPMHLQPALRAYPVVGGAIGEAIFANGLCLPSGSNLSADDLDRVVAGVRTAWSDR